MVRGAAGLFGFANGFAHGLLSEPGRHPWGSRSGRGAGINAEETTLAEVFKSKGYATAVFGKWHLGDHERFLPLQHGFDEYFGIPYSNDMWPRHPDSRKPVPAAPALFGE